MKQMRVVLTVPVAINGDGQRVVAPRGDPL